MKNKIVNVPHQHICLFCGKEIEGKYEEYDLYYECDCEDTKETKKIYEEIKKLKEKLPKPKFKLVQQTVLTKIN